MFMKENFKVAAGILVLSVALALPVAAQTQGQNGMSPTDAKILHDVQAKISDHPSLKNVKASVEDRLVTLTGSVDTFYDKLRAGRILNDVNDQEQGVRNLVEVAGPNVPDDQLRNKLADRLRYDRIDQGIMFNNFALQVHNGDVTIDGQARTDSDRDSALGIVETTKGVKNVVDNIKVLPTSNFDDDLRVNIARAIYGNPALRKYANDPQAPIRIVVDNGHVTLAGVVDSQMDKQIAENQAKSVSGVFSVKDNLVVSNQSNMAGNSAH
jgi:hyperosmotically inducible periplasmic protein